MGTRQLRLPVPLPDAALPPLIGQPVQVLLLDGTAHLGRLLTADPASLRLALSARGPVREIAWATVRELIVDREANH